MLGNGAGAVRFDSYNELQRPWPSTGLSDVLAKNSIRILEKPFNITAVRRCSIQDARGEDVSA